MGQIMITLKQFKSHFLCQQSWRKLLAYLGKTKSDDEPFPASVGLDACGIEDTLWASRYFPEYDNLWRLYAIWCAKQVAHLLTDKRSKRALVIAERFALGRATTAELKDAYLRAYDASCDAYVYTDCDDFRADVKDRDTFVAARAAQFTATDPARPGSAADAAYAATAGGAARHALRAKQERVLRILLDTETIEIGGWLYYIDE